MKENWENLTDRQWSIQASNQAIRAISLAGELQSRVSELADIIADQQREIKNLTAIVTQLATVISERLK